MGNSGKLSTDITTTPAGPLAAWRKPALLAKRAGRALSVWFGSGGSQIEHSVVSWAGESTALVGVVIATVGTPSTLKITVGIAMIVVGGIVAKSERIREGVRQRRQLEAEQKERQRQLEQEREAQHNWTVALMLRLNERNEKNIVDQETVALVGELLALTQNNSALKLVTRTLYNYANCNSVFASDLRYKVTSAGTAAPAVLVHLIRGLLELGVDATVPLLEALISDMGFRLKLGVDAGRGNGVRECQALLEDYLKLPSSAQLAQVIALFDEKKRSVQLASAIAGKRVRQLSAKATKDDE